MAYSDVSLLAVDVDFQARTTAARALEGDPVPEFWVSNHKWQMASSPGFGEAYAYALANNNERPGWDPSVITDAQILSAVQTIENMETQS